MARITPYFPLSLGVARVSDMRVFSGIVYVIKHGLQRKDAPKDYGPHNTLYNSLFRWSRLGVFDRIFAALGGEGSKPLRLMIDVTHLNAHCTAASLLKTGMFPAVLDALKGAEFKLHKVVDQDGKPICLLLSESEMSDYKSVALLLSVLLEAQELITDKGIDTDWFTQALFDRKIKPCIPPRKARTANIYFDKATYTLRHKI